VVKLPSFLRRAGGKTAPAGSVLPLFRSHEHCITFSALIRERWGEFKDLTRAIAFERSATIYAIGDSASTIYSIVVGRVKLVRLSPSGKEQTLGVYEKQDIFGEICLCGGTRREEQAVALEPTDAVQLNVDELLGLMKTRPEMLIELCMILCSRLHESQEHLAQLVFDDTRQRLAKQLLLLNRSFNAETETTQPITLTHEELAHLVNTTRERVTLLLNEFRRMGLIEYSTKNIRVHADRMESYLRRNGANS
jgi:CRP/FNR family transcriptional regulator, cyclic AMP receptor protein